jgi:N-acetylglucosamine-6-phosphate deacetylase
MIALSADQVVLADRVLTPGTLICEGDRIVDIRAGRHRAAGASGYCIVPGFVDVHVHGVAGVDVLDEGEAVEAMASCLPRYGVTAFCPTTVACAPAALRNVVDQVRRARRGAMSGSRVLPAHLESNFINPDYKGAQPARCLRSPRPGLEKSSGLRVRSAVLEDSGNASPEEFDAGDILREIDEASADIGIVTIAPELEGGLDLIQWLVARDHIVSVGHSAATFDEGLAAVAVGARHATHLFNRMPAVSHRAPGLAAAVLHSEDITAEIICDGVHVHEAMIGLAIRLKRPAGIMAITDGTAASGLQAGSVVRLGGQRIRATESAAVLDDGTLAGSILTMDAAFRRLVNKVGCSLVDAATMCASTPAREMRLADAGVIAPGAVADVVILDERLEVLQTYISGRLVYSRKGVS